MSDWDASDDETAVAAAPAAPAVPKVVKKGKFADEDASDDDIKDDWDASDDEEELAKKAAAAKPTGPAPPVRAKGATKKKIAEKEAAEQQRAEEAAARHKDDSDPHARKAREKAAMLKADMDNAASLFGSASVNDNPLDMRCTTIEDFEALAESISSLLIEKHGDKPLYAKFVEALAKGICGPLRDVDTRKTASALTALGNEKQKAQKDAAGGKKKKAGKPALGAAKGVGAGRADVGAYDEILDDSGEYDDFM